MYNIKDILGTRWKKIVNTILYLLDQIKIWKFVKKRRKNFMIDDCYNIRVVVTNVKNCL